MPQQIELDIAPREVTGKATKRLRRTGIIPANISGHHQSSQAVQIDALAFERLRRAHNTRSIFLLRLPNAQQQMALIRNIQYDSRTGQILHIDFSRVNLNERLAMKAPLHFVGESPAVKNEGGVLLHLLDTLDIQCLTSEIVEAIKVDISSLTQIDATIHARDVKLPDNYILVTDPEEAIAKVAASRAGSTESATSSAESTTTA
jgi:large subunit ribosomal protein L25